MMSVPAMGPPTDMVQLHVSLVGSSQSKNRMGINRHYPFGRDED